MTEKTSPETVAAIDVGSNSLRLLIAEAGSDGEVRELDRLVVPVMIGRDTFSAGRISNAVTRETAEVLKGFARVMKEYGVTRYSAIATSAVREALNRDTFLDTVGTSSGIDINIVETIEETRLVHQVVRREMPRSFEARGKTVLVLALGAGSAEITVFQDGKLILTETGRIGTLRLIETLASDASDRLIYQRLSTFVINVASTLERVHRISGIDTFVVVNSELNELFERNRARGVTRRGKLVRVTRAAFLRIASVIAGTSHSERMRKFKVGHDTAETLTAASVAAKAFLETTSAKAVILPSVSVLDSLLLDVVRMRGDEGIDTEFEKDVVASALSIGRKYHFDEAHSLHVEKLSLQLYGQLAEFCGLNDKHRLLLRIAAILHDTGVFISSRSHHKHSYYLVTQSEILGISPEDQAVIAHACRYHRKATPRASHSEYWALPQRSRVSVSKIAAILRIADALDRNHNQEIVSVRAVESENELLLEVDSSGDLLVDQWAFETKADLFTEVFGVKVILSRARN